jgi:hypothetical protein
MTAYREIMPKLEQPWNCAGPEQLWNCFNHPADRSAWLWDS